MNKNRIYKVTYYQNKNGRYLNKKDIIKEIFIKGFEGTTQGYKKIKSQVIDNAPDVFGWSWTLKEIDVIKEA